MEYDVLKVAIKELKKFTKCPKCKSNNTVFIGHSKIKCKDCKHVKIIK